jgi:hypothetical protein
MAAQTPRLNVWRKITSWLRRHKVLAVLVTAIAAVFLFLVGSWMVLQVQIHFERYSYMQAETKINTLGGFYEKVDGRYVTRKLVKSCAYTSVSIGRGSRSCSVNQYVIYSVDNIGQAHLLISRLNAAMPVGYHLSLNARSTQNEASLGSYEFRIANLPCTADYWYFTDSTLPYEVKGFVSGVEHGLFVDVGCEGKARAEYFPVKYN